MNKNEWLKILDLISFVISVIGAIFICIFEFVGDFVLLKFSTICFALSFLVYFIFISIRLVAALSENHNSENIENNRIDKKEVVFLVTKLILSFIAFCWLFHIAVNFA